MKNIKYPELTTWSLLCERPSFDAAELEDTIKSIFQQVENTGDKALLKMSQKFDGVALNSLIIDLSNEEFNIDSELAEAIKIAKSNIEKFHIAQKEEVQHIETMAGVNCWRKV